MTSSVSHIYTQLTCWHCDKKHRPSEEFCVWCIGWTLSTTIEDQTDIEWENFVVDKSDSKEQKERRMKDAAISIKSDKFVAVLGLQVGDDASAHNWRKAVFVHRPGGDMRLSISTSEAKYHASSRRWEKVKEADWEKFKQIVGTERIVHSLPGSFPKPDNA